MRLSPQAKVIIAVIWLILALLALGYAASSHAPEFGDQVYPGPGVDPYPVPVEIHGQECTRAWDGEPCYPSE